MATEEILTEIHERVLGLTHQGNLRLNGNLMPNASNRTGPPRIVGTGIASSVTISNAASTSNVSLVTFQVADCDGVAVAQVQPIDVYLSDSAAGAGLTATTASGGIAAGASGFIAGVGTTSKAVTAVTDATGKFILAITDSAKTHFYPVVILLGQQVEVGARLTDASYG